MNLKSKVNKKGFWDIQQILKAKCDMMLIFGERSNGKTYGVLEYICKEYGKSGRPSLLIRRYAESLKLKNVNKLFNSHIDNGILKILGCDKIQCYSGAWYCCDLNEDGKYKRRDKPFLYMVALNQQEISKGTFSDVNLKCVLFDEFLTRECYLRNEFVLFMNTLSTCIRNTPDTKVFLVGNTVNWTSPYFREMGLFNIQKMKQGSIDLYEYTNDSCSNLLLAVEYTTQSKQKNKSVSSKWFAFNNPQLKMITNGKWEMASYPHPNFETRPKILNREIYLKYENEIVCFEIQKEKNYGTFVLVRPYTLEIDDRAIRVYTDSHILDSRYHSYIDSQDSLDKIVWGLYKRNRFLYSDNSCGEHVNNFVKWLEMNQK